MKHARGKPKMHLGNVIGITWGISGTVDSSVRVPEYLDVSQENGFQNAITTETVQRIPGILLL